MLKCLDPNVHRVLGTADQKKLIHGSEIFFRKARLWSNCQCGQILNTEKRFSRFRYTHEVKV